MLTPENTSVPAAPGPGSACCTPAALMTDPSLLRNDRRAIASKRGLRSESKSPDSRLRPVLCGPAPDAVAGQVKAALWRIRHVAPERYASLVQLLDDFSIQLAGWDTQPPQPDGPPALPAILRAKKWIEAHHHEPLTLTRVANIAKMSPSHFCRSFHYATGTTFGTFLCRTRITHVCQLLADPHNTIAKSAFAAGFQSISQFNRCFRRSVGQTPSEHQASLLVRRPTADGVVTKGRSSGSPGARSCAA